MAPIGERAAHESVGKILASTQEGAALSERMGLKFGMRPDAVPTKVGGNMKSKVKQAARQARYRAAHPEKRAACDARYAAAHPEKIAAKNARYRAIHRENMSAYYVMHREKMTAYYAAYYAAYVEFIANKKLEEGCSVCGYNSDPEQLGYHHADPKTKLFKISNGHTHARDSVIAELAKCVVLCRPCHASEHKKMRRG